MPDARAFWTIAAGCGEIRPQALAPVGPDEVLVCARYSGISRGTESLVFGGRVPPSEYARMRAPFQAGDFPFPVKYGYSSVGRVEQGPPELVGRDVFVLHPHQTRYVVPAGAVHIVPEDVPPARAVLAANMETAINGLWDARPHVGDRVTVVGAGTVGCLVAWLARRIPGCHVELVDVNPSRAAVAEALGVRFARPETATPSADVVVHASGSPEGVDTALGLAGFESTVVEMSWFGDRPVRVSLGEAFHARRLTLRSSQVGHVAPAQRSRWSSRRRLELALAQLADAALDVLVSGETPFDDLPRVMPELCATAGRTLCHRITYDP
ncbi:MAG: zinc-binding alcohol dehydrogenase [Vicinamibacterales bacterium]